MTDELSAAQARRIALAAQGFAGRRPARATGAAASTIAATVDRLRVLQIDSVNVWERSHYMPVFSRLGAYDKRRLDALTQSALTEYWAHEATFVPVDDLPLFGFRMRRMRERTEARHGEFLRDNARLRAWLLDELADRGPLRASDIDHDENRRSGPWWGWSSVKRLLELMFLRGELAAAPRVGFERRYALPEQVLPPHVLAARFDAPDAGHTLTSRAAAALGVATTDDIADYFRRPVAETAAELRELAEAGEVEPVAVEGWTRADGRARAAWRHRDARLPRRIDRTALLTPFDPLVWHRPRALRLHGFHYRIEIYTPAHKRRYGYYSLPVLVGDAVCARVDLKNDRGAGVLRVQSAWLEPHAPPDAPARIAEALREAAAWQGLDELAVQHWGDLAPAIAGELGVPLTPRATTTVDRPAHAQPPDPTGE